MIFPGSRTANQHDEYLQLHNLKRSQTNNVRNKFFSKTKTVLSNSKIVLQGNNAQQNMIFMIAFYISIPYEYMNLTENISLLVVNLYLFIQTVESKREDNK